MVTYKHMHLVRTDKARGWGRLYIRSTDISGDEKSFRLFEVYLDSVFDGVELLGLAGSAWGSTGGTEGHHGGALWCDH